MASILVADDQPEIRRFVRLHLERAGFEVTEAKNGGEAWRLLQSDTFALVVTDIMMPELDGEQLLRLMQTKEQTPRVPVIVMCPHPAHDPLMEDSGIRFRCIHTRGLCTTIVKPFHPSSLLNAISRVLRG